MSDYIALLPKADCPRNYYKLNNKKNIVELEKLLGFSYIPNNKADKHKEANGEQLAIAPVAKLNQEMGVFTIVDIPYNPQNPKVLGRYKGEKINVKTALHSKNEINTSYYMDAPEGDNIKIDGKTRGNWTRFINHSPNPNIYAEIDGTHIWFMPLREIKAGEQLFIDYGHDYDFSGYDKIYLNTNDNWLSIENYFWHPTHRYQTYELTIEHAYFNLINLGFAQGTNQISLPSFYHELLLAKSLSTFDLDNTDWNLPLIGINKRKKLTPMAIALGNLNLSH